MVQFLSIHFFLGFLQFLLGFSKVLVFLCHSVNGHVSRSECKDEVTQCILIVVILKAWNSSSIWEQP